MKLIIEDDEGRKTVVPVVREEITIGRQDGNTIKLTERNVSRRHARFYRDNGALMLEDLGSYNGVRVNGDKIAGPTKVKEGDLIEIGDYDLGIQGKLEALASNGAAAAASAKAPRTTGESPKVKKEEPKPAAAAAPEPEPTPEPAAPAPAPAGQSAKDAGATAIIRLSDLAKPAGAGEIRDLEKNERPRLVGLNGAFRAKELYLGKTEVKVGRTDDNDIGIDHQSISRSHCKFVLEDGAWKVYDNKSANGLRINGEDYAVSAVKPGDTIELGHVKFRFCAPGERFVPPPEQPAAGAAPAAAAQAARKTGGQPAVAQGGGSKMPLIGGAVVGVLVIAAVAFFLLGRGGDGGGTASSGSNGKMSAEDATKQGDAAAAQHDYLKAVELYEAAKAKGTTPKGLKKAQEEAPAQKAYKDLEGAIAGNDFDKAKASLDALNADPDRHWAKQAQSKSEAVKLGYVKEHLKKAEAAKGSDADACSREATLALQMDSGNEEAQKIAQSCKGGSARPAVATQDRPKRERPAEPAGKSAAERNAAASKLMTEGNALLQSGDLDGALEKLQASLGEKPTGQTQALVHRSLGMVYFKKNDAANVVKHFEAYLPSAPAAEKPRVEQIIGHFKKQL